MSHQEFLHCSCAVDVMTSEEKKVSNSLLHMQYCCLICLVTDVAFFDDVVIV